MTENLINRISFYLASGGLFNPELADHLAVRNLLIECREALAQPERSMKVEGPLHVVCQCNKCNTQPEQEPVGQLLEDAFGRGQVMWFNKPKDESMLYTTTPQRTWVGLTDEELQPIADEYRILFGSWVKDFAQAIETKLRSKNNG